MYGEDESDSQQILAKDDHDRNDEGADDGSPDDDQCVHGTISRTGMGEVRWGSVREMARASASLSPTGHPFSPQSHSRICPEYNASPGASSVGTSVLSPLRLPPDPPPWTGQFSCPPDTDSARAPHAD